MSCKLSYFQPSTGLMIVVEIDSPHVEDGPAGGLISGIKLRFWRIAVRMAVIEQFLGWASPY